MTGVALYPTDFPLYEELNLSSNVLVNVRTPLTVNEQPLLEVRRGPHGPLVWLAAADHPNLLRWSFAVIASAAANPNLTVAFPARGSVVVRGAGQDILRVREIDEGHAAIDYIDLRPLGLNVSGSGTELRIGGNRLSRNRVQDAPSAFGLRAFQPSVEPAARLPGAEPGKRTNPGPARGGSKAFRRRQRKRRNGDI